MSLNFEIRDKKAFLGAGEMAQHLEYLILLLKFLVCFLACMSGGLQMFVTPGPEDLAHLSVLHKCLHICTHTIK